MPLQLTAKQKEAMLLLTDYETEIIGYGGGAGGGKSYIGCYWLMQMGYYAPGTKYFIGRDSLKDSRASVVKTWSKLTNEIGFTAYKLNDDGIKFDNGSEVELLDLSFYPYKDPMFERFGSKEYTSGWIEEASQVHNLAFEVLRSRVGRWKNDKIKKKILCTFNPKKNWVDTVFYRPFKNGTQELDTKFVFALASDNEYLPQDYIESLCKIKDKSTRERLLNGNFDYDDDPTALIQYDDIKSIWTNIPQHGEKYIICDVARFGSDKAIISVWNGMDLFEYYEFDISSTVLIQNTINALRQRHNVKTMNTLADEDGVGGGVVDNCHITGFVNNSKANNPQYYNLKSECGYELSKMIKLISFSADASEDLKTTIEAELGQLKTFESDKDGKLRILPKSLIKANIGRSPDWLDVFIMRMDFCVGRQGSRAIIL